MCNQVIVFLQENRFCLLLFVGESLKYSNNHTPSYWFCLCVLLSLLEKCVVLCCVVLCCVVLCCVVLCCVVLCCVVLCCVVLCCAVLCCVLPLLESRILKNAFFKRVFGSHIPTTVCSYFVLIFIKISAWMFLQNCSGLASGQACIRVSLFVYLLDCVYRVPYFCNIIVLFLSFSLYIFQENGDEVFKGMGKICEIGKR